MKTNIQNQSVNIYLIFFFVLAGIIIRLLWVNDMEWKWDERLMYMAATNIATTGELPATGMKSGGGIENPGLSMWVFGLIAKITTNPVEMVRIIIISNIMALLGFLTLALRKFKGKDQEMWLWGIALAAVSPMAILFSRKLWAQDILPILSFLVILGHQYRNKQWGLFLWGLMGALVGQIHMSGFFFAFGLLAFTIWHDYKNKLKTKWIYWVIGSAIGAIGLIPWILYLLHHASDSKLSILHIFQFNFFIYWFVDPTGLNITYSLRESMKLFLSFPWVNGINTYLVAFIHIVLIVIAGFVIVGIVKYTKKIAILIRQKEFFNKLTSREDSNTFYLMAILLGLGIIMTFSCIWIQPHYLIIAFPFPYIFVMRMLYPRKKMMITALILQLILSIVFFSFIHQTHGTDNSDYGKTYEYKINHDQFLKS
ncbi:MAG: hypothetical protein HXX18_02945 [Bacteroidetes bacterium]|nr:hypothetical protein [Bacteroidota bacterium]